MALSDHVFGGVSTDLKLALVEGYLKAFTKALRNKFARLWYIDAFAGTGERTVRIAAQTENLFDVESDERIERQRGSARIAIDVEPHFDRLIFIDKNPKHCLALKDLKRANAARNIDIFEEDANTAIKQILDGRSWSSTRAVMFLDPYGMNVAWETLEAISQTQSIDVWYLVSLSGIFRQAARDGNAVDEGKRAALTRMLGNDDWEKAWYKRSEKTDLFGAVDESFERVAGIDIMEAYVESRLKDIFPKVLKPLRLKNDRGVPIFALFFAISNPDPIAIGLASKIADHILKSGKASQVRSR